MFETPPPTLQNPPCIIRIYKRNKYLCSVFCVLRERETERAVFFVFGLKVSNMASRLLWASRAASYLRISAFHGGFASGGQTLISRTSLHFNLSRKLLGPQEMTQLVHLDSCEWWRKNGGSMWVHNLPLTICHVGKLWQKLCTYCGTSIFHSVVKDLKYLLKYLDSHEWVKVEGNSATVRIIDHAQDHLGDVVYVELLEVGAPVSHGSSFGAVEVLRLLVILILPFQGNWLK